MSRRGADAVAWAKDQADRGSGGWEGLCLKFVRSCFGDVAAAGGDAAEKWRQAAVKHPARDVQPPVGVPVFWSGGKHGHVALSCGDGMVYSTDIRRRGKVDRVPIGEVARRWRGFVLLGWSEDLNGVRVWAPAHPVPSAKPNWQWIVVDDAGNVLVRAPEGWKLSQGVEAGVFKPVRPREYRIRWREVG